MTLLEIIRKNKFATNNLVLPPTVATVAKCSNRLSTPSDPYSMRVAQPSVATVASVAVAKQETSKTVLPEETKQENRRQKVLNILAENPDSQRAFITDLDSDPENVILTIAIRDQYSFEMLISKDKYDGFRMLQLFCGTKDSQEGVNSKTYPPIDTVAASQYRSTKYGIK